jgi:diaminohydroxyphosphoribosylaminopyrimidine deaminase/5-amino-6-(5-phosphoribosylamino)uracil reductase
MYRCLELAVLGMGKVASNPMVGSVLVHDNKIIGEGYHQLYGEAHAEVNCINSVKEEHRSLIAQSVLYVSLEPCVHFGKTPPCADLIIKNKIPKVIVGCRDPFVQVNGKGIEKLRAAGIEVIDGVLEKRCKELNKRFFVFHTEHRPYIILKWAETGDKKLGLPLAPSNRGGMASAQNHMEQETFNTNEDAQLSELLSADSSPNGGGRVGASRLLISNEYTNRLVHKWRSEEMAILVGTNTALFDDPALTTRLWPGTNPIRIVVDMNLRLPQSLKLFDGKTPTIIFNLHRHTLPFEKISATDLRAIGVGYYQVTEDVNLVHQMLNALYLMNIQSVIVEGGAQLLQSFIDDGSWDEARIITNEKLVIGNGLPSPVLKDDQLTSTQNIDADFIRIYHQTVK